MKKRPIGLYVFAASLLLIGGLTYLAYNFPRESTKVHDQETEIEIDFWENMLAVNEREYKKKVTIRTKSSSFSTVVITSPTKETTVYKKARGNKTFWVVNDPYIGASSNISGEFDHFKCWVCVGSEDLVGRDLKTFHYNGKIWHVVENAL